MPFPRIKTAESVIRISYLYRKNIKKTNTPAEDKTIMKKLCVLSLAAAMATATFAQGSFTSPTSETANEYGFIVNSKNHMFTTGNGKMSLMAKETAYDILSCKEGSVFGNELTENTPWTGSACADAGRPGFGMEYYQHFDDCFYTFNEVRFLGLFNYWNQEKYS